jgi:hypothetical protein
MLINLNLQGKLQLLRLFNRIFRNHVFPSEWRKSFLIPILKRGKDPKNPQNYRPISLTNCSCKVLEKMVSKRLIWFLEDKKILSNFQSGFRKNRCTMDNLVYLESHIMEAFSNRQFLISIFFDIKNAYDRTWRRLVIDKMLEFGLKGNIVHFVHNFLQERSFQILMGNLKSSSRIFENGILQGSVLSVVLFILAINDIYKVLEPFIKIVMYCDDLCIFFKGDSITEIQTKIQHALHNIELWSNQTGFEFSKEKTVAMLFTRKYGQIAKPKLTLNSHVIPFVDHHRFLGITLDKKLSWKVHIKEIKAKSFKSMNLIKLLCHPGFGSDQRMLLRILNLFILPILDYGSFLYSTSCKTTLCTLDSILNYGLRLCTGAFKTSPSISLIAESGVLPLYLRRKKQLIKYCIQILSSLEHPLHTKFTCDVSYNKYNTDKPRYHPFYIRGKTTLITYNLFAKIDTNSKYSIPPWNVQNFKVDLSLSYFQKNSTSPTIFRKFYNEALNRYSNFTKIFTDGSVINSKVGCAFLSDIEQQKFNLGNLTTIFTAELFAIFRAILSTSQSSNSHFLICSDSLGALQSLGKMYSELPLIQRIQTLITNSLNYYVFL